MSKHINKSYITKQSDTIKKKYWLVNAKDKILGRMSTVIACYLRGKYKPCFANNMDVGDNVIVVNSDQVLITGKKSVQKKYYRHSGKLGNLRTIPYALQKEKDSTFLIKNSVFGMLPKNALCRRMRSRLKVYKDFPDHLNNLTEL